MHESKEKKLTNLLIETHTKTKENNEILQNLDTSDSDKIISFNTFAHIIAPALLGALALISLDLLNIDIVSRSLQSSLTSHYKEVKQELKEAEDKLQQAEKELQEPEKYEDLDEAKVKLQEAKQDLKDAEEELKQVQEELEEPEKQKNLQRAEEELKRVKEGLEEPEKQKNLQRAKEELKRLQEELDLAQEELKPVKKKLDLAQENLQQAEKQKNLQQAKEDLKKAQQDEEKKLSLHGWFIFKSFLLIFGSVAISYIATLTLIGLPENKDRRIKSSTTAFMLAILFPTSIQTFINSSDLINEVNNLKTSNKEVSEGIEEEVDKLTKSITNINYFDVFELALNDIEVIISLNCIKTADSALERLKQNWENISDSLNLDKDEKIKTRIERIKEEINEKQEDDSYDSCQRSNTSLLN